MFGKMRHPSLSNAFHKGRWQRFFRRNSKRWSGDRLRQLSTEPGPLLRVLRVSAYLPAYFGWETVTSAGRSTRSAIT